MEQVLQRMHHRKMAGNRSRWRRMVMMEASHPQYRSLLQGRGCSAPSQDCSPPDKRVRPTAGTAVFSGRDIHPIPENQAG